MLKRYCKQCGKELVRKKYKDKRAKRGWCWEGYKMFLYRNFCNYSCSSLYLHKTMGHIHWTKELILKTFNKIKTDKKWNSRYMIKNHTALFEAIQKHYKKHFWNKFVIEQGSQPMVNNINPKYKIDAKLLLKYFREEDITNGIGSIFDYSHNYGIPGYKLDWGAGHRALKYLIKLKAIRIFKKGNSVGVHSPATQYVLLKQRI